MKESGFAANEDSGFIAGLGFVGASGPAAMLAACASALNAYSLILASGSPRRRELLTQMLPSSLKFRIETSGFAEDLPKANFDDPGQYVMETARCKGVDVFGRCAKEERALVIAADTVVVGTKGEILEKPSSESNACEMLRSLSGGRHYVYTGVALFREGETRIFHERTAVTFSALSDEVISAYVATGECMDKAGAYGAQGQAGSFIEGFDGDYFNVVGLPLNRLSRELIAFISEPP